MADQVVDRRYVSAPVGNGQPHPINWAGNWGYDREREFVQQIGPNEHNNSGKAERESAPQRGDRSAKQQLRRRELAEREKQRRTDLANAFDELAAMLSKIEPSEDEEEEEEELVNGKKRRKKGQVSENEADTLGMNRLDLIGRTIDTLRRLHEENTDLKEHPMQGKGEEEEVLVMVPTHATTPDGPPRGRLGPPPFPHPQFYQQGHLPPQHQSHPQPILQSSSHDYHASPLQYYPGMGQGYGYPGGVPAWENGLNVPQSPHRDPNTNPYYQQQPHHPQQHAIPQMLYPHQQLHQQLQQNQQRSDRPPPPSQPPIGVLDVPKQMAPPNAAGWRPRPGEEETGSRTLPMQRPRDDSEEWVGRPLFRQY